MIARAIRLLFVEDAAAVRGGRHHGDRPAGREAGALHAGARRAPPRDPRVGPDDPRRRARGPRPAGRLPRAGRARRRDPEGRRAPAHVRDRRRRQAHLRPLLGHGHRAPARRRGADRRGRARASPRSRPPWRDDRPPRGGRSRLPLAGARRAATSPNRPAGAGPRTARASPSTGRTSRAPRPPSPTGISCRPPTASRTRSRRWASRAATAWRSCCRSGPRPSSPTSRASRWARSRCRCRSCSGPTRSNTGSPTARPRSRSSIRETLAQPVGRARSPAGAGARDRRGGRARIRRASRGRRSSNAPRAASSAWRRARAIPAVIIYTSGTTGPPKGALHAAIGPHRQPPGIRVLARRLPAGGRPLLVAGRLGVDGRPLGRAHADAAPRAGDPRLPRPLRPGEGLPPPRQVRGAKRLPLPDRAQDDEEGRRPAARAIRPEPALDDERRRAGRARRSSTGAARSWASP